MIIQRFGIILKALTYDDIELVRFWRNSDEIKRYALNQDYISKEQQEAWFTSLQSSADEYFIIETANQPIGLIWFNNRTDGIETGFYLYDHKKQNTLTPYKIVTLFHDYLFNSKGFTTLTCKIMHNNPRALRFNLSLGYQEKQIFENYTRYELSYDDYTKANAKISKLLHRENR